MPQSRSQKRIARTGFYANAAAYAAFWAAELARPGFVSRSLSVHIWLVLATAFGAWWIVAEPGARERAWIRYAFAFATATIGASIAWRLGAALGDGRVWASAFMAVLPFVLMQDGEA